MSLLDNLCAFFEKQRISRAHETCWIPEIWNHIGYREIIEYKDRQILINPFAYSLACLQHIQAQPAADTQQALNLDQATIYTALVRYTAAWEYAGDGAWQSGTFLRMIWLLPLLRSLGVNVLYLLPVTRNSQLNRKGALGSPYAVQDYFSLDPALHDPLLDDWHAGSLDQELAALIAACHRLGIRVVHDLIPRVTAMNNALVHEHPDWIYWIHKEALPGFAPPRVPELGAFEECTAENLAAVYAAPETRHHLTRFRWSPERVDAALWQQLKARAAAEGCELLTLVEQEMGLVPAPAHTDWINDDQPVWTDICFLRLYLDNHDAALPWLPAEQPPYVLFDTIKCNKFPAWTPNAPLWDLLEQVVTFQMTQYGFDGFRVDIGHTLPPELLQRLFAAMHAGHPHPLIISEDLFNRNHALARQTGYNIMLGSGWNVMADISQAGLQRYLRELAELQIHVFACAETPDTPRITSRPGGEALSRMLAVFNSFLPHAIPFLNTGIEVYERQPLNCGLADNTGGAEIPRAFFDPMCIDWAGPQTMMPLLRALHAWREELAELRQPAGFRLHDAPAECVLYGYRQGRRQLLVACNLSTQTQCEFALPGGHAGWQYLLHSQANGAPSADALTRLAPLQARIYFHNNNEA